MSTRSTLKYQWDEETQTGFNLFTDYVDDCLHGGTTHVYLELSGVDFQARSGGWVEVGIPREWAEKLGLLAGRESHD